MTALALLFAVFQARPSPFCILDEVDAALDDANVVRFLKMLSLFRAHTQFVVVTHNKGTMAACSHLYGITMETRGVSRQVSVELTDIDDFVPEAVGSARPELAAGAASSEELEDVVLTAANALYVAAEFAAVAAARPELMALAKAGNRRAEKLLAVLTDAQKEQWTALIGPAPPEVPEEERGGRRGGFGRRGGEGGGPPPGAGPAPTAQAPAATTPAPQAAATTEPAATGPVVSSFDPTSGKQDGETKLSFNAGAGLKWLPSKRFGARLQARYTPTWLDDASSELCDPFGFCQDWLHQLELTAGVVIRF